MYAVGDLKGGGDGMQKCPTVSFEGSRVPMNDKVFVYITAESVAI